MRDPARADLAAALREGAMLSKIADQQRRDLAAARKDAAEWRDQSQVAWKAEHAARAETGLVSASYNSLTGIHEATCRDLAAARTHLAAVEALCVEAEVSYPLVPVDDLRAVLHDPPPSDTASVRAELEFPVDG